MHSKFHVSFPSQILRWKLFVELKNHFDSETQRQPAPSFVLVPNVGLLRIHMEKVFGKIPNLRNWPKKWWWMFVQFQDYSNAWEISLDWAFCSTCVLWCVVAYWMQMYQLSIWMTTFFRFTCGIYFDNRSLHSFAHRVAHTLCYWLHRSGTVDIVALIYAIPQFLWPQKKIL